MTQAAQQNWALSPKVHVPSIERKGESGSAHEGEGIRRQVAWSLGGVRLDGVLEGGGVGAVRSHAEVQAGACRAKKLGIEPSFGPSLKQCLTTRQDASSSVANDVVHGSTKR